MPVERDGFLPLGSRERAEFPQVLDLELARPLEERRNAAVDIGLVPDEEGLDVRDVPAQQSGEACSDGGGGKRVE